MPILVQINVGEEPQKNGLAPAEALSAIQAMASLPGIAIRGLMTVPPYREDPEAVRPYFLALTQLAEELKRLQWPGVDMEELSMGMSHDYEVAVEEGATLVRIGSGLFGPR